MTTTASHTTFNPAADTSTSEQELDFVIENESASETVLLIHPSGVSVADWSLVTPHLHSYHLLMPALFTARSLHSARTLRNATGPVQPWATVYASLLALLVRKHARGGVAHVVGLSLGAAFAIALAAHSPGSTLSVFASGLPPALPRPGALLRPFVTGGIWIYQRIQEGLGSRFVEYTLDGLTSMSASGWDGRGGAASTELMDLLVEVMSGYAAPRIDGFDTASSKDGGNLRVRLVAATHCTRWVSSGDNVEATTRAAKAILGPTGGIEGRGNMLIECIVYEAPGMVHPWLRQRGDLFAECILATIEGRKFPGEHFQEKWRSVN